DRTTERYKNGVGGFLKHKIPSLLVYVVCVAVMAFYFISIPTAFLPEEDQGRMFVLVSTPPGSTTERTLDAVKQMEDYFLTAETKNIENFFSIVGFSFAGRGQNSGMAFVNLKHWDERKEEDQSVFAISQRAMGALSKIRDAVVFAVVPPAVPELGNAGGFDFQLLDQANLGHEKLMEARNQLLGMAAQEPTLIGVRPNGLEDTPQ